jgi:NADH-quinone oxidoreductase subunit F
VLPPLREPGPVTEGCGDPAPDAEGSPSADAAWAGALRVWSDLEPEAVRALVAESGLQVRGRWRRRVADEWARVADAGAGRRSVVCDVGSGAGAPAGDRLLVERAADRVIAGLLVAARATDAKRVRICVDAGHEAGATALAAALERAADGAPSDLLGRGGAVSVDVVSLERPAVCGGGTALVSAIETGRPRPRPRPPEVTGRGLGGGPTWIADPETCALLALVATHGAAWLRERGEPDSPGTTVFELTGSVERPGLYELPLGTRLGELLFEHAGGVADGRKVGAVLPGGLGSAALPPGQLDVPLLDDALRARGTALGRGRVVVLDDRTCMVAAAHALGARLHADACGHAIHCREGAAWVATLLGRMAEGSARPEDLAWLRALCDELRTDVHCGLAASIGAGAGSLVRLFHDHFDAHVHGQACAHRHESVLA